MMRDWLKDSLSKCSLTKDAEDYLLSRGTTLQAIQGLNLTVWEPPSEECPDDEFRERYWSRGKRLKGRLVCPYYSPRGHLIGMEVRQFKGQKFISDIRCPEAAWNPVWICTKGSMEKIWSNGVVWLVEGLFDLVAMLWVVPSTDAILCSVTARLSRTQKMFIRRFAKVVFVVFDMDESGRRGTREVEKFCGANGINCFPLSYRGGKDPGEIWDRGGNEELRRSFRTAMRMRGRDVIRTTR